MDINKQEKNTYKEIHTQRNIYTKSISLDFSAKKLLDFSN